MVIIIITHNVLGSQTTVTLLTTLLHLSLSCASLMVHVTDVSSLFCEFRPSIWILGHALPFSVHHPLHQMFLNTSTLNVSKKCGSPVAECPTRNRESPVSNPTFATVSKFGYFCCLHDASIHSAVEMSTRCLAIDSGGNVSE